MKLAKAIQLCSVCIIRFPEGCCLNKSLSKGRSCAKVFGEDVLLIKNESYQGIENDQKGFTINCVN
jgi:hypothetical protein